MTNGRYRVLLVCSHPVPYAAPQFQQMARHPKLDILVAYCSLQGAEPGIDPGFGVEIKWDRPLLDGYPWVHVPNRSLRPGLGRFLGLVNPGLWKLIRRGDFDAVAAFTGYMYASFWITAGAARAAGRPLLFGTDITTLRPLDQKAWKAWLKPLVAPRVFRMTDLVGVGSTAGQHLMRRLGIAEERIALTPFAVDNDWWTEQASHVDRTAVRHEWSVPVDAPVVLFCATLRPWKRPLDLLRAFAKANVPESYLVYAGDGPLRQQVEREASTLGVAGRVRMLGFVNQSKLPGAYCASDLLVVSSEQDACPVVVCEAMLCSTPVVLSDEVIGRFDLVEDGKTGFVYPCGNTEQLAVILGQVLADRTRLRKLGTGARRRMETWSPRENVEAWAAAIERAVNFKRTRNHQ
jgi:glycosyltransferase involved in cell wall biosynthesis